MTLKEINAAIRGTKRMGHKVPIFLVRFKAALEYERQWVRKRKLAETKLKKYRRKVVYYQKQAMRNEQNGDGK